MCRIARVIYVWQNTVPSTRQHLEVPDLSARYDPVNLRVLWADEIKLQAIKTDQLESRW